MLHNPCILGVPKQRGTKSELTTYPVRSWGPTSGRKMLHNPCILGGPQTKRDKIRIDYLTRAFLGGPQVGGKCYITPAFSGVPKQRGTKSELTTYPVPSWGPTSGRKMLHNPCILGVPEQRGTKSELTTYPVPSWGPTSGRKMLHNPCILGGPQTKRDKIRIDYLTRAFLGAHKWAENAT